MGCELLTSDMQGHQITKAATVNPFASKNVHNAVYECSCVALSRRRDGSDAFEFGPLALSGIETPGVVVTKLGLPAAEAVLYCRQV